MSSRRTVRCAPSLTGLPAMDSPWRIELLGGLRAALGDLVIDRFRTHATGALLAYLARHAQKTHPRELVGELLWAEHPPKRARDSLNTALSSLRRQLEPPGVPAGAVVEADRFTVRLNPKAVRVDTAEFERHLRAARRAETPAARMPPLLSAVRLYRGQLLPGFYEDWVETDRARLASAYVWGLERLAADLAGEREFSRAAEFAHRAVTVEPLREESYRLLMRIYAGAGRHAVALEHYRALERLLQDSLAAFPSRETVALAEAIGRRASGTDGAPVPLATPRAYAPGAPVAESGRVATAGDQRSPGEAMERLGPAPVRRRRRLPRRDSGPPRIGAVPSPTSPTDGDAPDNPVGSVPLQFTRFFGREPELERLAELLAPRASGGEDERKTGRGTLVPARERHPGASTLPLVDSSTRLPPARLVTLLGPGGSGKTRLAIEAANRLRSRFAGGVWFVPLADLSDPRLTGGAVRDTLRLARSPDREPWDQVAEAFDGPPALLILDNVEQLIGEGESERERSSLRARGRELLARTPAVTCVLTSRQRLDVSGERVVAVAPLPVPAGADPPERLVSVPSVALFVDRARAARPDFQVTPRNAAGLAALCRRLEGIPLSIELVAAWAQTVTVGQMVERLARRFDLVVSRRKDQPQRHRTLWAAIEWSYRLLEPDPQRFFRRLSAFRGDWTLEAAEAVCGEAERGADFTRQLRDRCLVAAEERDARLRYRMLESLREFAAEQMTPEERGSVAQRHAAHFLAVVEEAKPELERAQQGSVFERLEADLDNLRAALDWWLAEGTSHGASPEQAPSMLGGLWRFGDMRGHQSEGRARLAQAMALTDGAVPSSLRARALTGAGVLAWRQGDLAQARALHEESLGIWRRLGDQRGIISALNNVALVVTDLGEYVAARGLHEEGLTIARQLGDQRSVGIALHNLAHLHGAGGNSEAARPLYDESLGIWRQMAYQPGIANTLLNLGNIAKLLGDYAGARPLYEQSLEVFRELGDRRGIAGVLNNLGDVVFHEGDVATARSMLQESLGISRDLGEKRAICECLGGLGALAAGGARGSPRTPSDAARAARLLSAAAALREAIGAPLPPCDRPTTTAPSLTRAPPWTRLTSPLPGQPAQPSVCRKPLPSPLSGALVRVLLELPATLTS